MHILMLGPYPPPEGGISRNILAIRAELQRRNHRCSVAVITRTESEVADPDVHYPRTPWRLLRLITRLGFDVLHVHVGGELTTRMLLLLMCCATLAPRRCVLTFHSGGYTAERKGRVRRMTMAGIVFRRFRRVVGVNTSMVEMFSALGVKANRIRLIQPFATHSVDNTTVVPEKLAGFIDRYQPSIITVGLLEDAYNFFLQIDAMGEVLKKNPDAGLMIVGSGSLAGELKRAIKSKHYADRILLTGDVEHAVTLHLIDRADVLIRVTKFDGDAISIREALHLGTPVIATDNGMRPDGVKLIPLPATLDDLVDAVSEVWRRGCNVPTAPPPSDGRENIGAVVALYEEILAEQ